MMSEEWDIFGEGIDMLEERMLHVGWTGVACYVCWWAMFVRRGVTYREDVVGHFGAEWCVMVLDRWDMLVGRMCDMSVGRAYGMLVEGCDIFWRV